MYRGVAQITLSLLVVERVPKNDDAARAKEPPKIAMSHWRTTRVGVSLSCTNLLTARAVVWLCLTFAFLWGFATPLWGSTSPTTTGLVVSSGGSPVVTVASKTVVTLTARVQSGLSSVQVGQVRFCDAQAAFCNDAHLLGVAQLTPAGFASIKLLPGPGTHGYRAVFVGTSSLVSSVSRTCA